MAEHFSPSYDPWDQRLCAVPDADLFKALKRGRAEVVTGTIDTFVPEGVRLSGGRVLEADLVVTATGLRLLPFGGIVLTVDGTPVELSEQFVWNGAMLTPPFHNFEDQVSDEVKSELEEIEAGIIDGSIKVKSYLQ